MEDPGEGPVDSITVMIVEDHAAVAESLAAALSGVEGVEVIETAGDLQTGLAIVELRRPQVVLMDAQLPDGDGATAAPAVRERSPGTAVVVLSGSQYPSTGVRAVRSGAAGYVSKVDPLERIVEAVRAAAGGGTTFTPEQIRAAFTEDTGGDATSLTDRELQVLQLLAEGRSTEEMGELLTLSTYTVRNHVGSVLTKLGVGSRLQAVAVAHRRGLVDPPR